MGDVMRIGIKGLAYAFDRLRDIKTLPTLAANATALAAYEKGGHRSFGYSDCSLSEQAVMSAKKSLACVELEVSDLDAIVIGCASIRFWPKYAELLSTEILMSLGAKDIPVFGVTMGGCANYSNVLRIARALVVENVWRNVLIIETNKMPQDEMRPYMPYVSVFGDGSVSAIVSTEDIEFDIASIAHIAKPLDATDGGDPRFVTNNINGYRWVIREALRLASCDLDEIDVVIPNNKNIAELVKLATFWNVPFRKVYTDNVSRIGHLWSADNLINLKDFCTGPRSAQHRTFLLLCQGDSTYCAMVMRRAATSHTIAASPQAAFAS
jgi:3-oxoacyl-[acyl-carrier-protein] synthase III